MTEESIIKLIAGILLVYPECTQQLVKTWIEEQVQQGKVIEDLYRQFSAGHLRFSVVDGVLIAEKHPFTDLPSLLRLME